MAGTQKDKATDAGVKDAVQEAHDNRVELTDERGLARGEDKVDARLDNRTGADRPRRQDFPAVPQQVDGPDVAHQEEFTRRYLDQQKVAKAGDLLGHRSLGPHGLSKPSQAPGADGHDRGDESGGKVADNGAEGSPEVGKVDPADNRR